MKIHSAMVYIRISKHLFTRHLGQLPIPLNLHRRRIRRDHTILSIHIHSQTAKGREFLQLALWSRSTTKILQLSNYPQHSRQCYLAHAEAETLVRAKAKVGVLTQVTVQTNLFWVWPCLGIVACGNLDSGRIVRCHVPIGCRE